VLTRLSLALENASVEQEFSSDPSPPRTDEHSTLAICKLPSAVCARPVTASVLLHSAL
jgi:hypothetical protein